MLILIIHVNLEAISLRREFSGIPAQNLPVKSPDASGDLKKLVLQHIEAGKQMLPSCSAVLVIVEKLRVFTLHARSRDDGVLRLLDNRRDELVLVCNSNSLRDLIGGKLRGSPVVCFAACDEVREGPDDFQHRCEVVRTMSVDDINVVELEPFERAIDGI